MRPEQKKTVENMEHEQGSNDDLAKSHAALLKKVNELEIANAQLQTANKAYKKNEKELRQDLQRNEAYFKGAFDNSAIGMALIDLHGTWKTVNESICRMTGYSSEELMQLTFQEVTHPEDLPFDLYYINEVINGRRKSYQMEKRYLHKNGNIIWALLAVSVIRDSEGKIMHFISQIEDITDRKKAEADLQRSNERYEYVTKATFDAIWDWDLVNDEVYWGEGYQTLFGYDVDIMAAEKNSWSKRIHPDDFHKVQEGLAILMAGTQNNWTAEYRYLKANGEYAFVIDKGLVIRNNHGIGVRMIGAMQDITRKKSEEQQLKLFESVITNTNDAVMITGARTADEPWPKIVYVNEAFVRMTGYRKEEVVGKTPQVLQGNKSDIKALARLQQSIKKRETCEIEIINYKKSGEEFWVNFSIVPMTDEMGRFTNWIAIARDITQRKRQDAEKEIFFKLVQSLGKLDLGEAWISILEDIALYAGFEYAEAWMGNMNESYILLHKRWAIDKSIKKLKAIGELIKIKKEKGLTGNAWASSKVTYVSDITEHPGFLAKKFALENNLNSIAYIPVFFKGRTIALLSFYTRKTTIDHRAFDSLFDTISQQLGPYLQSKRAEDELARFFNMSPDLLAISGTDGYFKKINPSFSRVLGYTPEELFAKPISFFTHPDDRELTNEKRVELKAGKQLLNFENRYVTKNGETRWLSWTSTSLPEEGLVFAVAKDTTEKRRLDEERKRILESISDFFFALDKDFNFTYMNSATEELFGAGPDFLIGKNIWQERPSFGQGVFFDSVQKSVQSKQPVSFEFYDEFSDNWFENSFYPSDDGLSVFFRSINDRKIAEKQLEEALLEKDIILESIGDGFFTLDKRWNVTYWNKMSAQLLKVTRKDVLGKNLWEVFVNDPSSSSFYARFNSVLLKGEAIHFEEYYELLNIWLEVSAYPSRGGLSVYFKDISVRKRADAAIRISNERYNMVAKATNDAIWDWDLVTNLVIRPGKRLETLYGYEGCEPHQVDEFWNSHAHPEDWAKVNKNRRALFADPAKSYWEDEYRFLTSKGVYGYVYDKGYIIRNQDGKAIRMIGASQDITKEKSQVNEIIRIQQNLDSLINTTTDLIWSIDRELRIIAANKTYTDTIRAMGGATVKEGDYVIFPSLDTAMKEKWMGFYTRCLAGEAFHMEESFYNTLTGDQNETIVSFFPIIGNDGAVTGVACFAKDVTELKKAGQKLVELNNSLEKRAAELVSSNSELERFAYVASHDLQEPLRMVSSFLQLLEKKYNHRLDDLARKYIHFSVDGAERMKRLINDLLQYSRVGTASLETVPVDMNEVLAEVLLLYKNEVSSTDAEIITGHLPVIHAGKSAMLQLMQNLVGNALKYKSGERPVVSISAEERTDDWIFTVLDNGIGIDPKFKEKIFIVFQRLHNKDEFTGTGIGLAICKKIVERYHGKIWVESEFGKGSKFIFAIPKKQNP